MERLLVILLVALCSMGTEFLCYGDVHLINCTAADREALMDFKVGLNDPENRLSSWRGSNCCQWRGIGCDSRTGAVIRVDLHNPNPLGFDSPKRDGFWNLSGEIRPSLLKLKSLRYLDLSASKFQDTPIPGFFGSLRNLQYLNLSKAGFIGKIPPTLGNLSSLQYLDVSSEFLTSVDDLQWLAGLVSLKHLEMNQVDLSLVGSNWVEALNRLPHLTELHLSSCSLTSLASSLNSVNFTSLSVLDLSFNNLNSGLPDWFVNLTSLVYLDISSSGLQGRIPLGLSNLRSLKYLNLAMNQNLSASCLQLFSGGWGKIEVLDLAANKLHGKLPASIGNMTFLTMFDLFSNEVKGGIPSSIGRLCNLINLDLSGNNLTGSLPEVLIGTKSCSNSSKPLSRLMYLQLSNNQLVGKLPEWLGQLENLQKLRLSYNLLEGPIPASFGTLENLTEIGLGGNRLNGILPESFGQLAELTIFDVSSNQLTGTISESHFAKLSKLRILRLSSNSFIFNVSSGWIPPFHVRNLDIGSCHLGPAFPSWLKSQEKLMFLDFSNASISGSIPGWFWQDIAFNLSLLNASINQLAGQLPDPLNLAAFADIDLSSNLFEGPIPLPILQVELLDLSNNQFSGSIPQSISESMPDLIFLSLSSNQLIGEIPEAIGEMRQLQVLDLSSNNLTGTIPSSIGNCSFLKALDLGRNILSGEIPNSLGELKQLQSLHLRNNKLSGELPMSFQNLSSLETLDLGYNRLSGQIPAWFSEGFADLRILSLRTNAFSGGLPIGLSNLTSLQVLDLAENNLTAKIPTSLGRLEAMKGDQKTNKYLLYGKYRGSYYEESFVVSLKGTSQKYTKTLTLITSIDLSSNNLHGEIPEELTKLTGLLVLNLSRNQLSGQIPETISRMRELESLDLSNNKLSGPIPQGMSWMSALGFLNISNNEFTGRIPSTGQLSTFGMSSFEGNPGLCGAFYYVKCHGEDTEDRNTIDEDDDGGFFDKWLYLSVGIGFAAGILVPYLIIAIRRRWSDAYFNFVDNTVYGLPWVKQRLATRPTRKHRRR